MFLFFGRTSLFYAVTNHSIDLLKLILSSSKVNVNATNSLGWTALNYAAAFNLKKSTELLLMHKDVNPNIFFINSLSKEKETAICVAARNGSKDVAEMILLSPKFDPNFESRFFFGFKFILVFRRFLY